MNPYFILNLRFNLNDVYNYVYVDAGRMSGPWQIDVYVYVDAGRMSGPRQYIELRLR